VKGVCAVTSNLDLALDRDEAERLARGRVDVVHRSRVRPHERAAVGHGDRLHVPAEFERGELRHDLRARRVADVEEGEASRAVPHRDVLAVRGDGDRAARFDATLYAAPMSHGAGLYTMVHVLMGARHVCPPSGGFDAPEIFDLARHFGDLHLFAAPTMVKRMTAAAKAAGETGQGLRSVIYAGGPMYQADIIEATGVFGPVFLQIYGQGECPMGITALSRHDVADRGHPRWCERLGSVGRAQSGVEVIVGDADGRELPRGDPGEILVRGDTVMPGYWRNTEATAKTLVNGWLLTGDVGYMDADGYLTLQDRSKDMIISGGSNIYPREVEEVLLRHGAVAEVAVVGRPDPQWGEAVVAFVVAAAGQTCDPAALDAHCLAHMARFKRPKDYRVVAALPKNNYGKVLKTALRERLAQDAG